MKFPVINLDDRSVTGFVHVRKRRGEWRWRFSPVHLVQPAPRLLMKVVPCRYAPKMREGHVLVFAGPRDWSGDADCLVLEDRMGVDTPASAGELDFSIIELE